MPEEHASPERIETGWDETTPAGDTVLRQLVHTIGEDALSVAEGLGGRTLRNSDVLAADIGREALYFNVAVLLHPLTPEQTPPVMNVLNAFFDDQGEASGMASIFSLWPVPDLRPYGWTLGGHPPAHYLPQGASAPPLPANVSIRQATSIADLMRIVDCANAAFETTIPPESVMSAALLADPRRRYWIAEVDGMPAGGSAAFLTPELTYVSLVATHPRFRRRGIGAALSWQAALVQEGVPSALLSTDEGRLLYDRMGYLRLLRFTFWYRMRGTQPAASTSE